MKHRYILFDSRLYLAIALFIGGIIRFYGLDIQSLYLDELFTVTNASYNLEYLLNASFGDVHPPLHNLFLFFWIEIFGNSEISVRMPSAIAGFMSMIAMYLFTKQYYDKNIATSATILLSLTYAGIFYSQEARSYSFLILFSILATFLFMKIITVDEKNVSFANYLNYFIAAILTVYTHYFGLLLIALQLIYWFMVNVTFKEKIYKPIAFGLLLLVTYLPWLNVLMNAIMEKGGGNFWIDRPGVSFILNYGSVLTYRTNSDTLLTPILGILSFILLIVIPLVLYHNQFRTNIYAEIKTMDLKSPTFIALYLILSTSLISFLISQHTPILTPRNLLVISPFIYLMIALWVSMNPIFKDYKQNAYILVICLVCLSLMLPFYYAPHKEQFRESMEYSIDIADNETAFLFLGGDGMYKRYSYYINHSKIPLYATISIKNPSTNISELYYSSLMEKDKLIAIGAHGHVLSNREQKFLDEQYIHYHKEGFVGAVVYEYR